MPAERPSVQLLMRRPDLEDLPPSPALPAGYRLRVAADGATAGHGVAEVLTDAFGEPWDAERVSRVLSAAEGVQAVYLVEGPAGVAATASARVVPARYPRSGYLHWVAVHSRARGRHLGEVVTLAVLSHFRTVGLHDAVLETDDPRHPAIWTYLRCGFVPEYREATDQLRWSRVLTALARRGSARRSPG